MVGGMHILVAAEACGLRDTVRGFLETHGYIVLQANDRTEAMGKVRTTLPDLVLLDTTVEDTNDLATLQEIRCLSTVPVIMLGENSGATDAVHALHLGADDYLTKPFCPPELLARIESALRRAAQPPVVFTAALAIDEDLTVDFPRNRVNLRGSLRTLTALEHRLLFHLVSNAGRLMHFETLLARVWGPEYREDVHYVRLYVSYLRAKLEPDPAHPRYILTEKGLGYRFADFGAPPALVKAMSGAQLPPPMVSM